MKSERKKQIMTLSILVVAVLVISVGFAAFSSTLRINSTAQVNPNASDFKVVFSNKSDNVDESDVTPVLTPTTISASNGEINNTSNPTLTGLQANFTSPGEKVVYNLYVYNAGKYVAYLNSVTLKGNKSCIPGEGTSVSLAGQACEDIKVTVKVGNDSYNKTTTGIQGKSIGIKDSTPVEITIEYLENGVRADGPFEVEFSEISLYYATISGENEEYTGESGTLYTGVIYRNSTQSLFIGNNINPTESWCEIVPGFGNSCENGMSFSSKTECEAYMEAMVNSGEFSEEEKAMIANATCVQAPEPLTYEYETDLSNISQNYYLKHEVVNDVVTASYACITYTENGIRKDVCVRGVDPSYYTSNQGVLHSVESYFNTLSYNGSSTGKGFCGFDDSASLCHSDPLSLYARSDGHVNASDGSVYCSVYFDGYAAAMSSSCRPGI